MSLSVKVLIMTGKNGHKPAELKPWERQPAETEKAFQALRCYLEMGDDRSIRLVAKRLDKSDTLVGRWSKKHEWVKRAREYDNSIVAAAEGRIDDLEQRLLRSIMSREEVLLRTTFLGRATLDGALSATGTFDIKKARKTGTIHALRKVLFHPSGKVKAIELRDKSSSIELMGKHHGVWSSEIDDPDAVLGRILGIPKTQIPASFERDPNAGAGDVVEGVEEVAGNGVIIE